MSFLIPKRMIAIGFVLVLIILAASYYWPGQKVRPVRGEPIYSDADNPWNLQGDAYSQVLSEWMKRGAHDAQGQDIFLSAADYSTAAEGISAIKEAKEGKTDVLLLERENDWVEYTFTVSEAGLYQLRLQTMPLPGSLEPIRFRLKVDGQFPFDEAKYLAISRNWKDGIYPAEQDERGNDIRPPQLELQQWTEQWVADAKAEYYEPLRLLLDAGKHVLRLEASQGAFYLSQLAVAAPEKVAAYKEVKSANNAEPKGSIDENWYDTIEAEQMALKSDSSVQMQASYDDLAYPPSKGKIILNEMGGDRWKQGGKWAEWSFEVPEDGLYELQMKVKQSYTKDVSSFRQIKIDGKVPFRELLAYPFPYGREWQLEVLSDGEGNPFEFYLTKGKHTLSMNVTQAPLRLVTEAMKAAIAELQDINGAVRLVTGIRDTGVVDKNRDWNLEAAIPGIAKRFERLSSLLEEQISYLQTLYGNDANGASGIRNSIDQLRQLAVKPEILASRPEMLPRIQETLGMYMDQAASQPLSLDQIYVTKPGVELEHLLPGRWKMMKNTITTFARTFSPNYNYKGQRNPEAITVWVNRGRDYVTLMQQLADELFTPDTGISVNVNLMPSQQQLFLSQSSGRQPDAALGLDAATSVDLAMRNALVDLRKFADYDDIAKRFHPGSLLPFHYDHGDYALPETQSFNVMFYRTDILRELGLKPPETWDELYDSLQTIQQKGYDFFMPSGNGLPFFYQNGVSFYTADGLKSGLTTPESFQSFRQWTDLYTVYGIPKEANFYMHFRKGTIPLGISDFNTYLQLTMAAPEIADSWEMAPIPGMKKDSGEVERWAGGSIQAGIIMKSSKRSEDAWQFLKWWTSAEVQARFGNDIELYNGLEFRWNTANQEAFKRLPWPSKQLSAILEQWKWFKEIPNVPGGYFTARELSFAWNRTVLSGVNYRESLEQSIREINRELLHKQQEFGFVDKDGKALKELDIPVIDRAWEGGER
ncbi:extracellular solute-binding protein [Paenibacillus contaminans]|uniref:ABC transporter substrate-binding protein n=1 Tax=Paenibacillus contaminans TaxID=450362 RepID=A0A329MMQ6_9BACL|nr:extracellular solute-binding protein [Paenibacillus contaminans]RAV19187.1 ABC transporter substrate-binding protein [Paenibacillus contaminans]